MLSSEDKTLIEQYFQHNLDENTLTIFLKKLEDNHAFFEEVVAWLFLHKRALKGKNDLNFSNPKQEQKHTSDFEKNLSDVELDVYLEEEILKPIQEKEGLENTQKKEDLLENFRLVPAYEQMMATVERGRGIEVIAPSNRMYCEDYGLNFTLKKPLPPRTSIRIENNRTQAVFKQKLVEGRTTFTIELSPDLFPTGLYYWKLWNKNGMVMGSFLVVD